MFLSLKIDFGFPSRNILTCTNENYSKTDQAGVREQPITNKVSEKLLQSCVKFFQQWKKKSLLVQCLHDQTNVKSSVQT